jgi:hypothetical protein
MERQMTAAPRRVGSRSYRHCKKVALSNAVAALHSPLVTAI